MDKNQYFLSEFRPSERQIRRVNGERSMRWIDSKGEAGEWEVNNTYIIWDEVGDYLKKGMEFAINDIPEDIDKYATYCQEDVRRNKNGFIHSGDLDLWLMKMYPIIMKHIMEKLLNDFREELNLLKSKNER